MASENTEEKEEIVHGLLWNNLEYVDMLPLAPFEL